MVLTSFQSGGVFVGGANVRYRWKTHNGRLQVSSDEGRVASGH